MGLDENGELVGYVYVCRHHIDGMALYAADGDVHGSWGAVEPVTGLATWSLSGPSAGWRVETRLTDLDPQREYTLYGGTDDNSWSAKGVTFRLDALASTDPGQVTYWSGEIDRRGEVNAVASVEEFTRDACDLVD
ncbi:hypothetical protein DQ237_18330 [Blastococcus sp. TF02-8]|nr:hypothetical protein DQ237_18330 [Blastococcus sp. TF02-8]